MARNDTDWSQPQPSARQEREAQEMAEQIAASYGDDYGAGFFDYGPMTAPQPASPYQGAIDAADTALTNLAALQYESEQRQRRFADQAAIQDALALQRQQQAQQGLGFGASLGAVTNPQVYPTLTPGQQASLNQYLQRGPGQDYSFGIVPKIMGLLGAPTRYEQITSGDYRPVFVGDEFYGSFGAGPFGGQVYTGRTLPSDVAAEYGIPGFEDTSSDPEVVAPVADVTGQPRCPEGYIFDEDLQACRLDTSAPVMQPLEQRTPTRTYSLLDQAPDGLLEFQRRYGLPQQQMDFSLLT
jgi:hypothetical protein